MEQVESWRKAVKEYKDTYNSLYGHAPKEKMVESFCQEYKIPWPIPRNMEDIEFGLPPKIEVLFGGESEG